MGIEPFLLSSSLLSVLSQRLVRTLCEECKVAHVPSQREMEILGVTENVTIFNPVGCISCNHTGYRGRTGIHEQLIVDERIREMMHDGRGEQAIEKYIRTKTPSIRQDGCNKVLEGVTALEEVLRVTREE
jgi:general secretion pathway protein E